MPVGLVLSCEHAAWQLPPGDDLGVSGDDLRSQASWDPGALAIALEVGAALEVPVHAGAFSRMFVDLNRPPDHPDVIPLVSYGAPVPGNTDLSGDERARRLGWFHAPYWHAVRTDVRARLRDRDGCLHLCSHSFDPALDPQARQFEVGVLYDPEHAFEAALAERMLFGLRAAGLDVRANLPYRGTGPSIATAFRAELGARYGGIQLETSHAVVDRPAGASRIARAVAAVVAELLDT